MFASLFPSKKTPTSETTPLLAALHRYRSRHDGTDDAGEGDAEAIAQSPGDDEDEDEQEDEDRQRDGPLLPVFSSTFLGASAEHALFTLLTKSPRSHTHLQHHPRCPHNTRPAMRDHALLGPAALAAGFAILSQAHPAAAPLRPLFARHPVLSARQLSAVQEGE
jgi:hypothetical protein